MCNTNQPNRTSTVIGVFVLRQYTTHYSYLPLLHHSNEIPSSMEEHMLQWFSSLRSSYGKTLCALFLANCWERAQSTGRREFSHKEEKEVWLECVVTKAVIVWSDPDPDPSDPLDLQ